MPIVGRTARQVPAACRAFSLIVIAIALAAGTALAQTRSKGGDPARGEAKVGPCATCHGNAGRAPLAGMPLLAGQPEQFLELQLVLLREGLRDVPQMAPFLKGLTDRDLIDIAAYYARQALPKPDTARDAALYQRGQTLSRQMGCGSCHRADYSGQNQMPRIAGQREDYLVDTLKAYRDNKRVGTDTNMNGILHQVSDADLRALSHYLAHQ
jgi:cytochrome c553